MKIDKNFIETGAYNDTLNKAQFKILEQPYPPNEGWESLVLGREISTKDVNLFILLRGELSEESQEQIINNYQLLVEFHKKPKVEEEKPETSSSESIKIYCDGACKGNPGEAGSGLAIYRDGDDKPPVLLYGEYEVMGTNNTAELNALYKALLIASENSKSTIYSDSRYSIDCITIWAYGWKSKGWKKKGKGGEIKNLEIIKTSHALYENIKDRVTIKHVKGHSGVEGNELADRMAVVAIVSKESDYCEYDYESIEDVLSMSEG